MDGRENFQGVRCPLHRTVWTATATSTHRNA